MSTCFAASRSGLTFAIVTAALSILGGRQSGLGRALDQINISFLSWAWSVPWPAGYSDVPIAIVVETPVRGTEHVEKEVNKA